MATVIPPPVLQPGIGSGISQGLMFLGQGLGKRWEGQATQQDVANIMAFQQAMQQYLQGISQPTGVGTIAGALEQGPLAGLGITEPTQPQYPQMRSRAFQQAQARGLMEGMFGDPFGVQRTKAELQTAQAKTVIASPRAGQLQIAGPNDKSGLPENTVFQPDPAGNIKIIHTPGGEDLSVKEKKNLAVAESTRFRADPRIKNYQIIERSERGMQAALEQATSPDVESRIASDQALGVLFQKMLDPESVVRESEYARTPEGAALINQLLAIAPQLRLGGLRLLDEDRQAIVNMAQELLNHAKLTANKAFDEFETRADELGLNKTIIFGGAKKFDIDIGSETTMNRQTGLQQRGIKQPGVLTATNPATGQKIVSYDEGKTWRPTH